MARARTVHACTECGAQQPRWLGRCPECGGWNTLVEEAQAPAPGAGDAASRGEGLALGGGGAATQAPERGARPLAEVEARAAQRIPTGVAELDRVLGGGLVPGSVVLLAGEPGIGKSTLALQIAAGIRAARPTLYVSGEESAEQVRLRAERLVEFPERMLVVAETAVEALAAPWSEHAPAVVVVDSIQTLHTARVESAPGSVAQVRESAGLLAVTAKKSDAALLLIGHVTKEGAIAGPRVLEHMVDVVLTFEGDRSHAFRILRAVKNRFGSTREVGVFHMGEQGLEGVENPSEYFLAERSGNAPGSCIVPLVEGSRPMLVEIQALVAPSGYGTARRTCLGIDDGRVALLMAVLDRRAGVDLLSQDVYVNVAGGVRVGEPASDLGVALAIASSRFERALPEDVAACGELGLGGEVRRIARLDLRLHESFRLGFRRVLAPRARSGAAPERIAGGEVIPVASVGEAIAWLREHGRPAPGPRPRSPGSPARPDPAF